MRQSVIGICVIAVGVLLCIFSVAAGKKNIQLLLNEVLEESIETDYNKRLGQRHHQKNGPSLGKKIKSINMRTENGIETISFADSVEEFYGHQLAIQYLFAKINPLKPLEFNSIVEKALKEKGVIAKSRTLYFYNGGTQTSDQDTEAFQGAIQSHKVFIDAKNTAAVQIWIECSTFTYLKHSPFLLNMTWGICFVYSLLLMIKNKRHPKTHEVQEYIESKENETIQETGKTIGVSGITIDTRLKSVSINGRTLKTTNMTYSIFRMLAENLGTPVSREDIEKELWEAAERQNVTTISNRLHQAMSLLRNSLKEFPQYRIDGGKGKGYTLVIVPDSASEKES